MWEGWQRYPCEEEENWWIHVVNRDPAGGGPEASATIDESDVPGTSVATSLPPPAHPGYNPDREGTAMQDIRLSASAVASLRFRVKGWHFPVREQDLPGYRELVDAGILEPNGTGDFRFTQAGMEHREAILGREADRIERERYEPPDARRPLRCRPETAPGMRRRGVSRRGRVQPPRLPRARQGADHDPGGFIHQGRRVRL